MRKVPYYLQIRDRLASRIEDGELRSQIRVRPMALSASQAEPLKVTAGTPGLFLTRTTYDQHDNVIEFDQEFWRHDVLELEIDVETEVVATALVAVNGP